MHTVAPATCRGFRLWVSRNRALAPRRARKDETRRKIPAGAVLRLKVEAGDFDSRNFKRWLDKALTRKEDRELFGLPPA
jgi:hypothetical protein